MDCFTNGGYHLLEFGKAVKFDRRKQLWFSDKDGDGNTINQQIKVRFNDGGHGDVYGSISWEMPADCPSIIKAYQKYGNEYGVEHDLVDTVVTKAVTMSGPLMSSKESYSEKKNDLIRYMEDQIANGVYQTQTQEKEITDPLSGEKRTANIVTIQERNGIMLRQEVSPLQDFKIKTYNLSIKNIIYDDKVEQQIQQQQQMVMQVQTSIAQARQAEQAAITAAKNGEAEAAKAKWEQEVIKAKAVTEAQQELEVAQLNAKAAEQYKIAETLKGEGEGARRKAVMSADGALSQKIDAWIKVNQFYADAIKGGNWVPQIQLGGGGSIGGTNASELISLLTAKTARDISLDLGLPKQSK
jgi:regulator of protease activity HflC (stomatin/prohibitin superfamily)